MIPMYPGGLGTKGDPGLYILTCILFCCLFILSVIYIVYFVTFVNLQFEDFKISITCFCSVFKQKYFRVQKIKN